MDKQQKRLSKLIEVTLGSHESIKARQLLYAEESASSINRDFQNIVTGSRSEGFEIKSNQDIDVLCVSKVLKVVEQYLNATDGKPCLQLLYCAKYIGAVKLELCNPSAFQCLLIGVVYKNGRYFLSASKFNDLHYQEVCTKVTDSELTGPAVNYKLNDSVMGFQMERWPKCANEWRYRSRKYGWPRRRLVEYIFSNVGCHFVPTNDVICDEQHLFWRMSFCRAETILVSSLSYVQMKVLALLKLFVTYTKIILNIDHKLISSYHAKNVIFYKVETSQQSLWTEDRLCSCFNECLSFLKESIQKGFLPHYFLPGLNLHRKHLQADNKERLITFMDFCLKNGSYTISLLLDGVGNWESWLLSEYRGYGTKTCFDMRVINDGIFKLQIIMASRKSANDFTLNEKEFRVSSSKFLHAKSVTACVTNLDNITNYILKRSLDYINYSEKMKTNKNKYKLLQTSRQEILFCCHADIARGWLALAFYYHYIRNHLKALKICKDTLLRLRKPWMIFSDVTYSNSMEKLIPALSRCEVSYYENILEKGLGTFDKCKLRNMFDLDGGLVSPPLLYLENRYLKTDELHFTIDPKAFSHMIMFLSYYELNQVSKCMKILRKLKKHTKRLVKSVIIISNLTRSQLYNYIGVCYELLGDEVQAKLNYVQAIAFYPSCQPSIWRFREVLKGNKSLWRLDVDSTADYMKLNSGSRYEKAKFERKKQMNTGADNDSVLPAALFYIDFLKSLRIKFPNPDYEHIRQFLQECLNKQKTKLYRKQ